ncbi:MAG: TonB-dependent receptor [Ignavibacterium sp.]|nr:TonB-dependent receptor [Ignavibacterium sp.]
MYKRIAIFFLMTQIYLSAQVIDTLETKVKIFNDTIFAVQDSISSDDSLLVSPEKEFIIPLNSSTLSDKNFIISNKQLTHNDYKYTGDYLRLFPFNFIKDLGFTGQPSETFLYGVGNSSISYLLDGISLNKTYSNSFNLNMIQSEDIDSIEIIPLPRGFLYGTDNNPVSINFITKDSVRSQPYSRLRYYQGANRNLMLDGSFNVHLMKRLIGTFSITNRILDRTYKATDFSIWQGKFKLKYFLSNNVNIIASYNVTDYKAGYSGGVDVDSILSLGANPDDIMYNFRTAPMFYPDGKINVLTHLPRLRVLAMPANWLKTDASVFYFYNDYSGKLNTKEYAETKTFGFNINNKINYGVFNLDINLNYEKGKLSASDSAKLIPLNSYLPKQDFNNISGSVVLSANIDSLFIPSVFYKISKSNSGYSGFNRPGSIEKTSNGIGIDVLFNLRKSIACYIGASYLKPDNTSPAGVSFIEAGLKYYSDLFTGDVKYFFNEFTYQNYPRYGANYIFSFGNLNGFSGSIKLNYGVFLLESSLSFYSPSYNHIINVPDFQTQTGLYYKGVLFKDNLNLKTGFVFYYTGRNKVFTYENGLLEVPSSYKIDFTLAGEIQKSAIVYFTLENLLDNKYYLTPYYPMPERNIRFGVAWELLN